MDFDDERWDVALEWHKWRMICKIRITMMNCEWNNDVCWTPQLVISTPNNPHAFAFQSSWVDFFDNLMTKMIDDIRLVLKSTSFHFSTNISKSSKTYRFSSKKSQAHFSSCSLYFKFQMTLSSNAAQEVTCKPMTSSQH